MIEFNVADKPFGLYTGDFNIIRKWIEQTLDDEGYEPGEINIINCSDDYLLKVNQEHLNHNYYTDIITFDYVVGTVVSGDIFVSEDRISENAEKFAVSAQNEFLRVLIHGVLHLCGYGDYSASEKEGMRNKEDEYLKKFYDATKL